MLETAVLGNTFKIKFNLMRMLDNRLISSKITFRADLIIDDDASAQQQVTALSNIRKWFDIVVNGAVAYFPGMDIPACTIQHISNNLMFCPDEPYDHLLLILLTAKINAIGSGVVKINRCTIDSNLGEGFGNWFEGDPLDMLPSTEDWLGEIAYFDQPWWNRSDGGMIDAWVDDGEDPNDKPDILINLMDDDDDELHNNTHRSAEIIRPFKPVIVPNDNIEE